MQFVARQLRYVNEGWTKKAAFKKVEEEMFERRMQLEREQKIHMVQKFENNHLQQKVYQIHHFGCVSHVFLHI